MGWNFFKAGSTLTQGKQGRPPLLAPFLYEGLEKMHPRLSHRQRLNLWYAYEAMGLLQDQPCFGYFYDAARDKAKVSLLAELGRLGDEELIRQVAAEVAELARQRGLSVKEAEGLLRRYRLRLKREGII